jgi:hypothetical protein
VYDAGGSEDSRRRIRRGEFEKEGLKEPPEVRRTTGRCGCREKAGKGSGAAGDEEGWKRVSGTRLFTHDPPTSARGVRIHPCPLPPFTTRSPAGRVPAGSGFAIDVYRSNVTHNTPR